MKRCETCNKFIYVKPEAPKVGDKVNFMTHDSKGNWKGRSGKLFMILDNGQFSVIYRKTVYRVSEVMPVSETSPLTLAFVGICECNQ